MRIVGKNKRNIFLLVLIALGVIAVIALLFKPVSKAQRTGDFSQYYLCDAEKVEDNVCVVATQWLLSPVSSRECCAVRSAAE